jgi:Predicted extracellular nuclease
MKIFARWLLGVVVWAAAAYAQAGSPNVVISQIYGGGGNTGSTFRNDFIELFNRGKEAVDLSGWSIQYSSATAADWVATPLQGTIAAGGIT